MNRQRKSVTMPMRRKTKCFFVARDHRSSGDGPPPSWLHSVVVKVVVVPQCARFLRGWRPGWCVVVPGMEFERVDVWPKAQAERTWCLYGGYMDTHKSSRKSSIEPSSKDQHWANFLFVLNCPKIAKKAYLHIFFYSIRKHAPFKLRY